MLLLVLILVLIAFALLVVALLSGSVLSAWLAVGVSVLAGIVLVVDWLQRRAALKAGPGPEPVRASVPGDIDPVTEVFAVLPSAASPAEGPDRPTSATPFQSESDSQQTLVMSAVRPSGSGLRPSGATADITPSGSFSSPSVTETDGEPTIGDPQEAHGRPSHDGRSDAEQTIVVGARRPKDLRDDPAVIEGLRPNSAEPPIDDREAGDGSTVSLSGPSESDPANSDPSNDPVRANNRSPEHVSLTNGAAALSEAAASGVVIAGAEDGGKAARPVVASAGSEAGPVGLVKTGRPDGSTRPDEPGPDVAPPHGSGPDGVDTWSRPTSGAAAVDGSTVKDLPVVRSSGPGSGPDLGKTPVAAPAEQVALNGAALNGAALDSAAIDTPSSLADETDGHAGVVESVAAQHTQNPSAPGVDSSETPLPSGAEAGVTDGSTYAYPAMAGLSADAGSSGIGSHVFAAPAEQAAGQTAVGGTSAEEPVVTGSSFPVSHDAVDPSTAGSSPHGTPDDVEPPEEAANPAAAHIVSGVEDEVLVIDERPRYHVAGCRAVLAEDVIPLPAREAVDLGFTPCGWCSPDATLADRHRADAGR